MEVPVPAPGYWTRKRFNSDIKPDPLPSGFKGDKTVLIRCKQEITQTPVSMLAEEISHTKGLSLIVNR